MTDREAYQVIQFLRRCIRGRQEVERLTQRQIARLAKVSTPTLTRFLQGKCVDPVTFLKLCEWIGLPVDGK